MFEKILIANRGEIACRVMATAQSMGIACVAVYSDADRTAKHVAMADQAVHIGGSKPAESYLRADVIVAAALACGAEAIHPGYGFLSENPDFVEAVETAGLVFIGPSASAMRAMGLKDQAKQLMQAGGVPVVPGYHGDNQEPAFLSQQAAEIGFPVLIKAVAGGGGKGMRLVTQRSDFAEALASAQAEALSGFGNGAVLIEKYITTPRHIEIQVFGDGAQAVHLFERDCSLQRRHQKVIEEAPAPGMTPEMRAAMGQAAVTAAQMIGYKGAGTVEFIVDASDGLRPDRFWFMEMNTRLQVEHTITEEVYNIDIVKEQINISSGKKISLKQNEIKKKGHSIECRINAENPITQLPSTGLIKTYHPPGGPGIRIDSALYTGCNISSFYDGLISKLVCNGNTRHECIMKLKRALDEYVIEGVQTNIPTLKKIIQTKDFIEGNFDINWLSASFK